MPQHLFLFHIWEGQRRDPHTKKIIPIYNQIDYIICHRRYKHSATNARSYGGTIVTSDHKLVITTFKLEWFKVWRKRTTQSTPKINTSNIVNRQECRLQYQQRLDTRDGHRERKKILKSRYKATRVGGQGGCSPLRLKKIQYFSP